MQQSTLPPQQPAEPPLNLCELVPSTERIATSYVPKSIPELEERIRAKAGPDGVETVIGVLCVLKRGGMAFLRNRSCFSSDVTLEPGSYVRAMHGDVVAVQLNPMNMWKPVEKVEDEDEESLAVALSEMPQALPDGRVVYDLVRSRKQQPPPVLPKEVELTQQICGEVRKYTWPSNVKPSGMVICVLHRDIPRYYVGRVAFNAMPQTEPKASFLLRFRLYDPRMPQITVQWKDIPAAYKNDVTSYLFILKLVDAGGMLHLDLKDAYRATIHGCCGMANASSATMGICAQYELPSESFEDDVEACIPADFTVPSSAEELAAMKRRDLRETEFVCTIDPATARDLDDALSIRRTPSGYHVGVHIADVSYFVQRGTPIDEEAARRCTSTYLVNKVISMLPRKLSEDYCSLNPSEDKFAFSALFEVDAKGQIISEWFGQSVIRSRCRLSYEQAQEIVDGKHIELDLAKESAHSNTPEATLSARVHESVLLLYELASIRRAASLLRGRLAIPNARLGFTFDEKDTTFAPTSFHVVRQIRSNWVVEEFMLLANFRTAEKIVQFTPKGAILREHNAPSNEKMKALRESLDGFGIKMVGTSARDLYETIEACQGHPHYDDVCELMKYSMQRAHYVSNSMEASAGGRAHFAIGAPWYTHFTSPIRRYCDIIAHRQLLVALEAEAKMKEMQLTLPSRPDPSIVQDPAKEAIDTATYFAPEDLEYGHLWYSYSEVNEIVIRANDRSRKAKEAGEDSCEVFFCLFLQALQKKAQVDGGIPSVLRTTVVVLQMRNDGMNLYASEVAMNVKVGFKDNKQLFQIKEGDSTTNTKEARKPVDGKAAPPKNKKDKNPAERSTICKLTSTKKILSWGPHPETGVEEEEEIHLCSELVVELIVNTQKKLVVLDMIVRPPWDRKIAQPIPKALFVAE